MNKLILCLIFASLQVLSLARSRIHRVKDSSDPDNTDWDSVKVIADAGWFNNDVINFFDARIIKNSTHSDIIYQRGLVAHGLPNVYLTPVGHALINITINVNTAEYLFAVQLQDAWSQQVYQQVLRFGIPIDQARKPTTCKISDDTNTPSPISPPIVLSHINFTNTTEVSYDLVTLLWNQQVIAATIQAGVDNITAEADLIIGQGQYNSLVLDSTFVDVEDNDLLFNLEGIIWKSNYLDVFKTFTVQVQLNPSDNSASIVSWNLDSTWTFTE